MYRGNARNSFAPANEVTSEFFASAKRKDTSYVPTELGHEIDSYKLPYPHSSNGNALLCSFPVVSNQSLFESWRDRTAWRIETARPFLCRYTSKTDHVDSALGWTGGTDTTREIAFHQPFKLFESDVDRVITSFPSLIETRKHAPDTFSTSTPWTV